MKEGFPPALQHLAQSLEINRKNPGRRYHLLLTSTISFTPDLLRRMCGSDHWSQLRSTLRDMTTSDKLGLLNYYFGQENRQADYMALALLIKAGYFSTIFTTNLDAALEDALWAVGMREHDFRTLIVGRETNQQIASYLNSYDAGEEICLLKLHGSLHAQILPARFPDLLEVPVSLQESLRRCFEHDLLILGTIKHDEDLQRLFSIKNARPTYYVIPQTGNLDSQQDYGLRLIEARYNSLRNFVISGPYAEFVPFTRTLLSSLKEMSTVHVQAESALPLAHLPDHSLLQSGETADVLLVTVTEIETRAVLKQCSSAPQKYYRGDKTYYNLGVIGQARTFLVQSEMHSEGPAGSHATVDEGIRALTPQAIVMLGIACGLRPGEQHIGDILVSQKIMIYDHVKIAPNPTTSTPEIQPRGDRVSASPRLLDRFKSGHRDINFDAWEYIPQIHFGLVLSGNSLINHTAFLEHLQKLAPDALGAEMEGSGLYSAAWRSKIDWILVKAISDWGDGNKDLNKTAYQQRAAASAARFVLETLAQGGFDRQ